jgi:hypothetical protein
LVTDLGQLAAAAVLVGDRLQPTIAINAACSRVVRGSVRHETIAAGRVVTDLGQGGDGLSAAMGGLPGLESVAGLLDGRQQRRIGIVIGGEGIRPRAVNVCRAVFGINIPDGITDPVGAVGKDLATLVQVHRGHLPLASAIVGVKGLQVVPIDFLRQLAGPVVGGLATTEPPKSAPNYVNSMVLTPLPFPLPFTVVFCL